MEKIIATYRLTGKPYSRDNFSPKGSGGEQRSGVCRGCRVSPCESTPTRCLAAVRVEKSPPDGF